MFSFFKREITVKTICTCQPKEESKLLRFSQGSQIITMFITFGAVVVALCQIKSAELQAQQQLAKSLYQSYLELAFEHPEFAEPKKIMDCSQLERQKKGDVETCLSQYHKYEWFVSRMLYALENILALELSENERMIWEQTVDKQVKNHSMYLKSADFSNYINTYSCKLLPILERHGSNKEVTISVQKERCSG